MANSGTGLKKETAAALSYLFGPISGFIFLLLEKDKFVRAHAMQSIVSLGIVGFAASTLWLTPSVQSLLWLVYVLFFLTGMYNASQGKIWEAPVVGKIATKLL